MPNNEARLINASLESRIGTSTDGVPSERHRFQPWTSVSTWLALVIKHGAAAARSKENGWLTDPLLDAYGNDHRRNSNPNVCGLVNVTNACPEHYAKSRMSCRCHNKEAANRQKN